jgi:hypothetical protein
MAWAIHPENTKPIGGDKPWARIVPELPAWLKFETRAEAEAKGRELVQQGVTSFYIIGYDA